MGFASALPIRRLLMGLKGDPSYDFWGKYFMLKVFIDDSGRDGLPVFILCGLVAKSTAWDELSEAWQRIVISELGVKNLKMKRFMNRDFNTPDGQLKYKILVDLINLINKYVDYGVAIGSSTWDYNEKVTKKVIESNFKRPYNINATRMFVHIFEEEFRRGRTVKADFVFDTQFKEENFFIELWRDARRNAPPPIRRRMGNDPIWVNDEDYPPLQAADMVAWILRRDAADLLRDAGVRSPGLKGRALYDFRILSMQHPIRPEEFTPANIEIVLSRYFSKSRPALYNLNIPLIKKMWGPREIDQLHTDLNRIGFIKPS